MGPINMENAQDIAWMGWSVQDVANWVESLLGAPYSIRFLEKKIDGPTLLELSEDDLRTELGMEDSIHRKKILGHLRLFRTRRARYEQNSGSEAGSVPTGRASAGSPRKQGLLPDGTTDEYLDVEEGINASINATLAKWPTKTSSRSDLAPTPPFPGMRGPLGSSTPPCPPRTLTKTASAATSISSANSLSQDGFGAGLSRRSQRQSSSGRMSPRAPQSAPTISSRGISFTTAPKRHAPRGGDPGPATYYVQSPRVADRSKYATIGKSARNTQEFLIAPGAEFGASAWECAGASKLPKKVTGGVFGTAARFSRGSPSIAFSPR